MKSRPRLRKKSTRFYLVFPPLLCLLAALWGFSAFAADDSVCAEVKLEIKQELTLERQAFDAHMRINNGLSHITLEDMGVDVNFSDEEGNSVLASSDPDDPDALFFIRLDSMENIDNVDGTGLVQPSSAADIHWLIIPATGASNGLEQGTLYYVGATLSYTIGGEEQVTEVTPDYIFVKPMPELTLDYFLPPDVYGDDAFTSEIEPPVPFSLGVRVSNSGDGVAKDLKIGSAQPKIVENEQGLLIGFVIEGCEVNGQPATPSLLADLGDIDPNASAVARWVMTCSLSGQFVEFTADFSHSDELGGELTSLLEATNTHFLVRDVLVDVAGRDSIRDFLAKDGGVYRVYESEGMDTDVADQSSSSSLNGSADDYTLSTPITAGFIFVQMPDPHNGQKALKEVVRSDAKHIKSENAWLSKTRNGQAWDYFINLFDANTTGSYSVAFEESAEPAQAPVLQFIPNRTAVEGEQLSFIVQATDGDGTIPALDASPIPALAGFTDQGDGTGVFDWTPASGQAGQYEITFIASDGTLDDSQRVTLTICPADDTDCDGMPDAWEMDHFGTLDRDGTGDFDGDGVSDLDEFMNGTDPTQSNRAPTVPVIETPAPGTETTVFQPDLVIQNSTDEDGDTVTYEFELYADEEMTALTASAYEVAEGAGSTSWAVPVELNDNTWHYWRVRASDGPSYSLWAYGTFFVNTQNDPPGAFHTSSPKEGAGVDTITPVLAVTNSEDPDEDGLIYAFEVYADSGMTTLVASVSGMAEGEGGSSAWTVDTALNDNTWYYWRAIVTDEHGATAETSLSSFQAETANSAPTTPAVSSPAAGSEVGSQELDLVVANATDGDSDPISYFFELDKVNTFDSAALQASGQIAEGTDTTSWHVTGLEDNTRYYWRVKAGDGAAESLWVHGDFFVNTANDSPATPTVKNPGQSAWVHTPTPVLELNPSSDADQDNLTRGFEVYADEALTSLIAQADSTGMAWIVPVTLTDGTRYYWRGRAKDEHDQTSPWTAVHAFFVKDDGVDDPPEITILEPAQDIITNGAVILIQWEDSDPDTNAQISLFYDTDASGEDGTLIQDTLAEDPDGTDDTYQWDVSAVPDGTYYVYATITDGTSSVTGYSPGSITLDRVAPTVTATPPAGTYTSAQTVTLSVDETADIYYTTDDTDPSVDSPVYVSPIDINETTTLKVMAVDAAGNQSDALTLVYTLQADITVTVQTSKGRSLDGVRVYAFTEAGSYTGVYATTDAGGVGLFDPEDLADDTYKFRVDYLGYQFWSNIVAIPPTTALTMVIDEETVEVTVTTGSGPAQGVRVYLFSETGSYLGLYGNTDANGMVSFDLPVGRGFKFRADILTSQYWSDVVTIAGGGTNSVPVDAAGGIFQVTVQKDPTSPMEGIKVYLFKASGSDLGLYQTSDASGVVGFDVPGGTYKVRADYLGYQFWSEETLVSLGTNIDLTIAHQPVEITVQGMYQGTSDPMQGIKVYLFTSAGSYLNWYEQTDANGKAVFDLPQEPYKVRADYLSRQYWSEASTWQDITVNIPMADAEITVTGAGFPKEGVNVYVFTASGSYLSIYGTTDADGKAVFRLPEATYKFRVDYQTSQFWSGEQTLTADQVNPISVSVGGGAFPLTVQKDGAEPLAGVNCYVFDGAETYLNMFGSTNGNGEVSFDLSDNTYKFRVDYLGYQFWSDVVTVPPATALTMVIEDEAVEVTVTTGSGPAQGVRVYLFSDTGTYLGLYEETDANGMVSFDLPVGRGFKFRADILDSQYWSDVVTVSGGGTNSVPVDAGGGLFQVTVQQAPGTPMEGIKVYLFSQSGSYLGLYDESDASGMVEFDVPEGTYKVRADYLGYFFWGQETLVTEDTNIDLTIAHQQAEITVQEMFQGTPDPMEGIKVYLFTPTGSCLDTYEQTDSSGKVYFDLPEELYKVRADYLSRQYWSEPSTWQDITVNIPMADVEVTVTGAGFPQEGVEVYAFTASGFYLDIYDTTDADGKMAFRLPEGAYKFRIDYQEDSYWSVEEALAADQVNPVVVSVGGGSFTFTVLEGPAEPMPGMTSYVFNEAGTYLGMFGATNASGEVFFDLADGTFKFRVDHLGYQFWSGLYEVPTTFSETLTISHQDVTITVEGYYQSAEPMSGVEVYLFTPVGSYLGRHQTTDVSGQAAFLVPDQEYKVRADYLENQYWSAVFQFQDATVTIQKGLAQIHAQRTGADVEGARVYLFTEADVYLGWYEDTDVAGETEFLLPVGSYRFRVDEGGDQAWSNVANVTAGQVSNVDVSLD